jgi:hypothetical protein
VPVYNLSDREISWKQKKSARASKLPEFSENIQGVFQKFPRCFKKVSSKKNTEPFGDTSKFHHFEKLLQYSIAVNGYIL